MTCSLRRFLQPPCRQARQTRTEKQQGGRLRDRRNCSSSNADLVQSNVILRFWGDAVGTKTNRRGSARRGEKILSCYPIVPAITVEGGCRKLLLKQTVFG